MYKQIIVLDAGHGGSDSGAVAYGYKEKNMTLKIVQAAKKYFDKDPNIKVYYTRHENLNLAPLTGLEPVTYGLTVRRSTD